MGKMEKAKFNPKSGLITFFIPLRLYHWNEDTRIRNLADSIHLKGRRLYDKHRSSSICATLRKEQYLVFTRVRYTISRVHIVQFTYRYWKNSRNRTAMKWTNVCRHLNGEHTDLPISRSSLHDDKKFCWNWETERESDSFTCSLKRAFPWQFRD